MIYFLSTPAEPEKILDCLYGNWHEFSSRYSRVSLEYTYLRIRYRKLISDDKDAINYIQEDYFGSFHCNGKQWPKKEKAG